MAADLEALLTDRKGSRVEVAPPPGATSAGWPSWRRATRASPWSRTCAATSRRAPAAHALADLQARLDLPAPPVRIECYDISNLGETYAVASMVVFEAGAPAKSHYRTFTMRYDGGPDDFARMEEAITRRFSRMTPEEGDPSFASRRGWW